MTPEEIQTMAEAVADLLGETDDQPRATIAALIAGEGVEFVQAMLEETLRIEAEGGMRVHDNSRRRTPGGVFFYLVKGKMNPDLRQQLFPQDPHRRKGKPPPADPEFKWKQRLDSLRPLLEQTGVLTSVKIVLIGRPGKLKQHKDLIITTMTHSGSNASLPRGVPKPPDTPTVYTVYISARQWRRIEPDLAAVPDDSLVIEGTCAFDPEIGGMAVFATSVITRSAEARRRAEARASGAV